MTPRILADAHASGMTAVNFTFGYVFGSKEPFESTVADVAYWDRLERENARDLIKVLSVADIVRVKASKKIGVIYGFQNAAMMGNDASRVDMFADMGFRIIQLTYKNANQLGDGSMAPENRGLTKFGHEVLERLNANGVIVDLTHLGQQICLDAARASKQPISINQTGCRALTDLPRNKTDEELRLVADKGGLVDIYFMPFLSPSGHATASDVVAHIEHAVKVCGEDHVGIGTDGGTTKSTIWRPTRLRSPRNMRSGWPRGYPRPANGPTPIPSPMTFKARTSSANSPACWLPAAQAGPNRKDPRPELRPLRPRHLGRLSLKQPPQTDLEPIP